MKLSSHISLIYICMIVATSLLPSFSKGQGRPSGISYAENLNEKLFLATDRDIYISGEKIYLKAFCRDAETNEPSFISKVAYISLLDHESIPVAQVKVWLNGSSGSGKFMIPETLPTGRYMISACTEWMRNLAPESYACKLISVINPFISIDHIEAPDNVRASDTIFSSSSAGNTIVTPEDGYAAGRIDGTLFQLMADKAILHPREKVTVRIKATNGDGAPTEGDIAVSVFKSFAYDSLDHVSSSNEIKKHGEPNIDRHSGIRSGKMTFLPEPEGHIVKGAIYSTITGEPIVNENIVLSFVGKTSHCYFDKTDGKGVFTFVVYESGKQEIFVQPLDKGLQDYYIELANPFPEEYAGYESGQFYIDTARLDEINNAIISMQVQALYDKSREASTNYTQQNSRPSFYGEPDHEIVLADFIELTSLEEVFRELLLWAPIRTRAGQKRLSLINEIPDELILTDPFLILDGIPVLDHEALLAIPNTQVEKIKLMNSRYFIRDMCLEGIIEISTIRGDLKATRMEIPGLRQEFEAPLQGSDFNSPQYLTDDQKNSRIPDCRNTLYWDPDIKTDKNGDAIAEFYTSDEPGDYLIMVEGITDDGLFGSASLLISVEAK